MHPISQPDQISTDNLGKLSTAGKPRVLIPRPAKKNPARRIQNLFAALLAATVFLSSSNTYSLDYFNYGNDGSSIAAADQYSNTDGSTTNATLSPNSATSDLFFFNSTVGSSGALTLDTMGSMNLNSMTFRSNAGSIQINRITATPSTSSGILYNFGGGITLEAGSGPVTFGGDGQRVVIGARADNTITNNSSSDLTFNREVMSYTANTTHTYTVAGSGSGNTIFYDIRTSSSGRETAMTIDTSGSGIVKFVGTNTYLGATTINAGTLQIGDGGTAGALATGSAITNNGTLVFNRSNTITQGTNFASAISGTGNLIQDGSGTLILSGNNTYTGTTTVNAGTLQLGGDQTLGAIAGSGAINLSSYNLTANSASSTTFSGVMSGTGAFTKSGSGSLTLSGSNTYTGATTIDGGTLQIGNGGTTGALDTGSAITNNCTLVFNRSDTATQGSDFASTIGGTGGLTQAGSGTLILSGGNTYTGATTINVGTLQIGSGSTTGTLSTSSAITNNGTLVFNRSNTVTQGTDFASSIGGTGNLTQTGSGTLTLTGNNSYSGITTVSAGTLTLNNAANNDQTIQGNILINGGVLSYGTVDNQIADSSNLTITSGTLNLGSRVETINSITMSGGRLNYGNFTLQSASSFTNGSYVRQTSSSSAQKISTNGTTTIGNATFGYSHGSANAGGGLFLNGDIYVDSNTTADFVNESVGFGRINLNNANRVFDVGSGATMNVDWLIRSTTEASGSLTKNGSGTLNLTNQNIYSGGTTINDGTIILGHASNTLSNGAITINGGTLSIGANSDTVGTITLAGGDITGTTGVLTGSSYELQSGNVTAILGGAAVSATKTTGGTVTLSGNNTYTGATTIEGGTLEIAASGSLGEGTYAGNITNNATLIYSGTTAQEFSGVISGTGAMTYNASSTLTLSGGNTYTGDITISTGTIEIGVAGRLGGGSYSGNISNSGAFIYSGTNTQTLSGEISGTGSLTQNGSSTLTLTGNNSYTGTTTIHAGTIRLQNTASNSQTIVGDITVSGGQLTFGGANQIDDSSSITLTSGSVELSIYNETIDSLTMSGGSLRRASNTLALNSASSFTGGTLNFASTTARIITNGTTTLGDVTFDYTAGGSSTLGLQLGNNIVVNNSTTANFINSGGGLGRIDLNGANRVIDVGSGATMNVDWSIDGASYGITKNGSGTVVLNANNTYTGDTVVNAGILGANASGALGATGNITVHNGGSLLVTASNAINDSTAMELAGGTLAFNGTVTDSIGALTLSADSIIDLGTGSVSAAFADLAMGLYNLSIYNWTGTTLWNGGDGNNTDKVYFNRALAGSELERISFYSDFGSSFVGTGFQLMAGSYQYEVIPVPEPETWATAALLLIGGGLWMLRKRKAETALR